MELLCWKASWYALYLRPGFERVVAHNLQAKGFEEYLPLYRRKNRAATTREVELPLFPGYVFCRFNLGDRLPILMIPGVKGIVGDRKGPAPVNDGELDDIRLILESGARCEPKPFISVGKTLRVETGPLAGLEGSVVMSNNSCRLLVPVKLLHRSVAVEIDRRCLKSVALG
jgi:transcription antitermination factor NusG